MNIKHALKDCKILKKILKDLSKWKRVLYSWIGRPDILRCRFYTGIQSYQNSSKVCCVHRAVYF